MLRSHFLEVVQDDQLVCEKADNLCVAILGERNAKLGRHEARNPGCDGGVDERTLASEGRVTGNRDDGIVPCDGVLDRVDRGQVCALHIHAVRERGRGRESTDSSDGEVGFEKGLDDVNP